MTGWTDHLIVAPIIIPLLAGALLLLYDERRRTLKATISLVSTSLLLIVAIFLACFADTPSPDGTSATGVYQVGNWPAPFGIVLVVDHLSALMLVLTAILGLSALVFSLY